MIPISHNARQPSRQAWSMERLILERSICLGMTLDPNTFRSYSSHLNSYLTFCALHHFDVEPTPDTLSYYITFMSHHIQPRSVDNYLSGIVNQLEPHFPSVRAARQSSLVRKTLRGAHRLYDRPVSRKHALSRDDLTLALTSITRPFTHDDLLWITQLFCGFFGLLRLGELVSPDEVHIRSFSKLSLRTSVTITPTSYSFLIQREKSDDHYEGNRVAVSSSLNEPDPLSLFKSYLASRDHYFPLHPLLWIRSNGTTPTRSWFIRHLASLFPNSNFSGHSMRAGGATSLAAAGVPPDRIRAIGRWRSPAWERYIRKNPALLQALLFHGRSIHDPPFADVGR